MKQIDCVADGKKLKKIAAPPPLSPPPALRFSSSRKLSVEQMVRLLKYLKQKRMTVEDHFLAAI